MRLLARLSLAALAFGGCADESHHAVLAADPFDFATKADAARPDAAEAPDAGAADLAPADDAAADAGR